MASKIADYGLIVASYLIGIISIALLIMMRGPGVLSPFGWTEPAVLVWDAGLSFLFFFQHSGMVRLPFRRRLSAFVPEYRQPIVFAIASGIALALVGLLWQPSGILILAITGIPRLLMRAVSALATAMLVISFVALRSFDMLGTSPVTAHLKGRGHQAGPFMIRGPYRWVRHPLYAGLIVLFWTNPDLTADRLLFNILWSGWMVFATALEEKDLVREFGAAYVRYQHDVPMLVPHRRPAAPV